MKRLLTYVISALMVLTSCSLEDLIFSGGKEYGHDAVLRLDCSHLTKSMDGEDVWNENLLKHIDVFFYPAGQSDPAMFKERISVNAQNQAVISVSDEQLAAMFPGTSSSCEVYVIANRPEGTSLPDDKSILSLKAVTIEAAGFSTSLKQESFVMDGQAVATLSESGSVKSVSGTVPLYRAASKITLSVNKPSQIEIKDDNGNVVQTWIPNPDEMEVRFNNGVSRANVDVSEVPYTVQAGDYFKTAARNFTANSAGTVYSCEAPFYSYSSQWEKTDDTNAYFTLVVPWSNDGGQSYKNCYYQVLINSAGRRFERNWWYNMILNVGVLGSFVEDKPLELDTNTYYLAEWGSEEEGVTLRDWVYLIIPEPHKEIDNKVTGTILYESSHDVTVAINSVTYQTFTSANPTTVKVSSPYTGYTFTTEVGSDGNKYIRFDHVFSDDIFSPIVIAATVTMTVGDITFSEEIEVVQYPPIWVAPYQNSEYTTGDDTVFVNGYNADSDGTGKTYTTDQKYWLGSLNDKRSEETPNMYVITVSSLHSNNTFSYNGSSGHEYVIGDPRVRTVDNLLSTGWQSAPSIYQGEDRGLTYYYPTDSSDDVYNVIAPKFRIVSAYSSSGSNSVNSVTAEMRCAAYQEDGYPAGRWRLPTYAEVQFAVMLQSEGFIPNIFKTSADYYFSTGDLTSISTDPEITTGSSSTNQGSVRCVYDDWYWGSERACDEDTFTWGDQPR